MFGCLQVLQHARGDDIALWDLISKCTAQSRSRSLEVEDASIKKPPLEEDAVGGMHQVGHAAHVPAAVLPTRNAWPVVAVGPNHCARDVSTNCKHPLQQERMVQLVIINHQDPRVRRGLVLQHAKYASVAAEVLVRSP